MKLLFLLLAEACICSGAQVPITTVQLDYWNWTLLKPPASADGIVIDPTDDKVWYVASTSGLFVTSDGGLTWSHPLQNPINKRAIAIDPFSASRVYAGSGSSIYISEDKGKTWTPRRDFLHQIASIFVSGRDGTVFVGPRLSAALSGIYQSSDRGLSWQTLPFGSSYPGLSTTWDLAEDDSGALWAATEAVASTGGKSVLRSADRGGTWTDISGQWGGSPVQLFWDPMNRAMYAVGPQTGIVATGNQGNRWVTYTYSSARSVLLIPGSLFSELYAGLDIQSGGGVVAEPALSNANLIDPHVFVGAPPHTGLDGLSVTGLAANHSGTLVLAAAGNDGIYVSSMHPRLNPSTVFVSPGGALVVACAACSLTSYVLNIPGQSTFSFSNLGSSGQVWFVPASLPAGTYQAQLQIATTIPPLAFTLIVGPPVPTITKMTSLRFATKAQFAQGDVATLFGYVFTGSTSAAPDASNSSSSVPLQKQLAQTQVLIDGTPVPLYFAYTALDGTSQINLQIPYSVAPGPHTLRVNRLSAGGSVDASSADFPILVSLISPTYSGTATIPIFAQDLTQDPGGRIFVTADTPMRPGDVLVVYATGLGSTIPAVQEGSVPPPGVLANVAVFVTAVLQSDAGQWTAELFGAVASPVYPGLYQIAFRVPPAAVTTGPTMDLLVVVGADLQKFSLNFIR